MTTKLKQLADPHEAPPSFSDGESKLGGPGWKVVSTVRILYAYIGSCQRIGNPVHHEGLFTAFKKISGDIIFPHSV